jgi:hypothetical protein
MLAGMGLAHHYLRNFLDEVGKTYYFVVGKSYGIGGSLLQS